MFCFCLHLIQLLSNEKIKEPLSLQLLECTVVFGKHPIGSQLTSCTSSMHRCFFNKFLPFWCQNTALHIFSWFDFKESYLGSYCLGLCYYIYHQRVNSIFFFFNGWGFCICNWDRLLEKYSTRETVFLWKRRMVASSKPIMWFCQLVLVFSRATSFLLDLPCPYVFSCLIYSLFCQYVIATKITKKFIKASHIITLFV